jgi:hypothetical protein
MALEAVDPAFDRAALAVVGFVELRRPAASGAELLAVADAVRRDRNGRLDTASAQVGAAAPAVVRFVRPHPVRSPARRSGAGPGHPDGLQHWLELRGITSLPGCDQHRQRLLPLLDGEVNLGGQPTPGASETVVGRFGGETAWRFLLLVPFSDAPAACW